MRVCVCGLHRDGAVKRLEEAFEVESVNINYPGLENSEYRLFDYAAETFKYFNLPNVVFDGGVFDCFKKYSDAGWNELQEQVIHSVIGNLDKIVIITGEMDEKDVEFCKTFEEMYPDKFIIISSEAELTIG